MLKLIEQYSNPKKRYVDERWKELKKLNFYNKLKYGTS